MIDDYDRIDYCDVASVEDLRPFLAHVLDGLAPADQSRFLGDLARIATAMRSERSAHPDLPGKAWIVLETARLDGECEVTGAAHQAAAGALAAAGLVDIVPGHRRTTLRPNGEW